MQYGALELAAIPNSWPTSLPADEQKSAAYTISLLPGPCGFSVRKVTVVLSLFPPRLYYSTRGFSRDVNRRVLHEYSSNVC